MKYQNCPSDRLPISKIHLFAPHLMLVFFKILILEKLIDAHGEKFKQYNILQNEKSSPHP